MSVWEVPSGHWGGAVPRAVLRPHAVPSFMCYFNVLVWALGFDRCAACRTIRVPTQRLAYEVARLCWLCGWWVPPVVAVMEAAGQLCQLPACRVSVHATGVEAFCHVCASHAWDRLLRCRSARKGGERAPQSEANETTGGSMCESAVLPLIPSFSDGL